LTYIFELRQHFFHFTINGPLIFLSSSDRQNERSPFARVIDHKTDVNALVSLLHIEQNKFIVLANQIIGLSSSQVVIVVVQVKYFVVLTPAYLFILVQLTAEQSILIQAHCQIVLFGAVLIATFCFAYVRNSKV
jgi:hypothetical protein